MSTIIEVDEFTSVVEVIDDGQVVNNERIKKSVQPLTNRTKNLKARLDAGVTLAKHYADAAALRAETTHTNGSIAVLRGAGEGALYVYDSASSLADDGALVIKPADVGGGAGRWLHPTIKLLKFLSGVTFDGPVTLDDGATVGGLGLAVTAACSVGSTLTVTGSAVCNGGVDCNGNIDVSGTSALHGAVTCSGNLGVAGTCTVAAFICTGGAQFQGAVEVLGMLTATGGVAVTAASTLSAVLASTGAGRVRKRLTTISSDANFTASIGTSDIIYVPSGVLSATRNCTVSNTGAATGDTIKIFCKDATWSVDLYQSDGVTLIGSIGNTGGSKRGVELVFNGSSWLIIGSAFDDLPAAVGAVGADLVAVRGHAGAALDLVRTTRCARRLTSAIERQAVGLDCDAGVDAQRAHIAVAATGGLAAVLRLLGAGHPARSARRLPRGAARAPQARPARASRATLPHAARAGPVARPVRQASLPPDTGPRAGACLRRPWRAGLRGRGLRVVGGAGGEEKGEGEGKGAHGRACQPTEGEAGKPPHRLTASSPRSRLPPLLQSRSLRRGLPGRQPGRAHRARA
jgi:hypothetical protein